MFLQVTEPDFSNVGTMIECGLFTEALDAIRCTVFPGLLPPASYLVSLLEYAQQVGPELQDFTPPASTRTLNTALKLRLIQTGKPV